MKRKKYRDWLWVVSISIFLVCSLEGVFWYKFISPVSEDPFVRFLCYLQNGIKAFKLDPDIKLKDVAAAFPAMEQWWLVAFSYLYCIAVIVAPFCTVAALAVLVRKPVDYLKGLKYRGKEKKVLLLGEGETKALFADALPGKACRVRTVETKPLGEERQIAYLKKGIRSFIDYSDRETEKVYRDAGLSGEDILVLCDDDPVRNMLTLKQVTEFYEKNPLKKKQEIYVICEDEGMKEVFGLYYDEYLKTHEKQGFDLVICDMKERAVRRMLSENPIYTANEETGDMDVHLGILGFGSFGQQTLLQALNLAVFSKDSAITVDVFDRSMEERFRSFLKRFSIKIADRVERNVTVGEETCDFVIRIPDGKDRLFAADGKVTLRFWKADTDSLDYRRKIGAAGADTPFTYFVIALKEDCEMTVSMMEICRNIYGNSPGVRVPVILRTAEGSPAAQLFTDGRVSTVSKKKDIYSLKALSEDELTEKAKAFNYRYSRIASGLPDEAPEDRADIEKAWHRMNTFKRTSSLYQAMHQDVKKWAVSRGLMEKEAQQAAEHRRWNLFMILNGYRYDPERNDLKKTHDCLSVWEDLKKERPDTLEYDYTPYRMIGKEN